MMSVGRGTNNIKGVRTWVLFQNKTEKNPKRSFFNPKLQYWVSISNVILDGLDFEVETNERKYQTFQILLWFSILPTSKIWNSRIQTQNLGVRKQS